MNRSLPIAAVCLALAAPPAFAAEPAPDAPSPGTAAMLSGLLPVGGAAAALVLGTSPAGVALTALSPLLAGAGQVYAGDPTRGFWIGAGGVVLPLAAGLAAYAAAPQNNLAIGGVFLGVEAAYLGYASWDAYHLAARAGLDHAAVPPAVPPAPARTPVAAPVAPAPAAKAAVTYVHYRAITTGMTLADVRTLLGGDGEERSWKRVDDRTEGTYRWTNADGSYLEVTTVDDQVAGKTNRDLR